MDAEGPSSKKARSCGSRGGSNHSSISSRTSRRDRNDGNLRCDSCDSTIRATADYVQNLPCNHKICTLCVVKSNMQRGSNPVCCQVESCHQKYTESCQYFSAGSPVDVIQNERVGGEGYSQQFLPMEYLKANHLHEINDKAKNNQAVVLYLGRVSKERNGEYNLGAVCNSFVLERDEKGRFKQDFGEEVLTSVRSFFARLHPILVSPSLQYDGDLPVLTPREYLELKVFSRIPFLHALHSLSTGRPNIDEEYDKILNAKSDTSFQNQYLAAAAASDILLRSNDKKPNLFQLMFGQCLESHSTSKDFKQLCSAFQLAPSAKFSMKARSQKYQKSLQKGLKASSRDLVAILSDNIGFKQKGKHASYDQWTVTNIIVILEKALIDAGIYCDDDPGKRLSRSPNCIWQDAIDSAKGNDDEVKKLIDTIVGLNQEDYERLAESVMEDIRLALDYSGLLQHNNSAIIGRKLPRLDRICNQATRDACDKALRTSEPKRKQTNATKTRSTSVTIPRHTAPGDMSLSGVEESKNRYDLNNALLEPLHENLGENVTQYKLMKYVLDFSKNQVDEFNNEEHPPNVDRPVAEDFVCFGCDGQPAAACHIAQAQSAIDGDGDLPPHLFVSPGGFHTVMKILNANGELFEDVLRDFVSAWRNTIDKQNWFLWPTDPRQRKMEQPILALAHNVVAAVNLSESRGGADVSAVEVYEFMLERAKEYPICMLVLLEQRLAAIAKMMENASRIGERGSVELFLTAVKFAMRVFAMTHKTDYMRLTCNILLWWHCASDLQKKLYSSFIFTQLTSKGTSVFHDLFVELSVKDIRQRLGKVYTKGLELNMEHACASIPDEPAAKTESRQLRNTHASSDSSPSAYCSYVNSDFISAYDKVKGMDLWSPGKAPILGRDGSNNVYAKKDALEIPGRKRGNLHASILYSITGEGDERTRKYFHEFYMKVNNRVERPEKEEEGGVSLAKMSTTVKKLEADKTKRILRETSTKAAEIKDNIKIADITDMYNKLLSTSSEHGVKIPPLKRSMTHIEYATALAKQRKAVFNKKRNMKEDITNRIEAEFKEKELSREEDRVSTLKDQLFTFPQSILNNNRYKEKISMLLEPIATT